jgi:hypothetical protein
MTADPGSGDGAAARVAAEAGSQPTSEFLANGSHEIRTPRSGGLACWNVRRTMP